MSRFLPQAVVPSHFGDGLGLALRVFRRGGKEGRFALATSLLGLCATPLDLALRRRESKILSAAPSKSPRLVLVCGPPRCGTTIVELLLVRCLGANYLTNLTAVFPRSPLASSRLLRIDPRPERVGLTSHYGKTLGLRGPSDSLHLWDRWLGPDRRKWSNTNPIRDPDNMRRFFAAWSREFGSPIVTKNNGLNVVASTVGRELADAVFLCLHRDPVYLAQSLLLARRYIHGEDSTPYGIHHQQRSGDPFSDVAKQISFFEARAAANREALGQDRFWDVSYEEVCSDPSQIVQRVARFLDLTPIREVPKLESQNRKRLSSTEFQRLNDALALRAD